MADNLGDRIKKYEQVFKYNLTPRSPLLIRIDGKAFHTFTKGLPKPFSLQLIGCMVHAAQLTAKEMSGFKLAYIQSDEVTFMITDFDDLNTQGWFDYELNKIVSITASAFTGYFNREWDRIAYDEYGYDNPRLILKNPAMFDARAFTVPQDDWQNVFIWRQRDWERNSIQMLARAFFSHKECTNKKIPELHEMLYEKTVNWADLGDQLKNGTFVLKDGTLNYSKQTYQSLTELVKTDKN